MFPARVSYKSVPQSDESVARECPTRAFYKSVSYKSVKKCLGVRFRVRVCIRVCGFHLFFLFAISCSPRLGERQSSGERERAGHRGGPGRADGLPTGGGRVAPGSRRAAPGDGGTEGERVNLMYFLRCFLLLLF